MSKHKKNNKLAYYAVLLLIIAFGVGLVIFGLTGLLNLNLAYEKAKIACDDRDYSSYIKKKETQTPGNENINQQIEMYKRAMDNARAAGDYSAYGQLNEEYTRLLALQAQTSTTNVSYDYSEVNKAKTKCYSLADEQKNVDRVKAIILLSIGGVVLTGSMVFGILHHHKKSGLRRYTRTH